MEIRWLGLMASLFLNYGSTANLGKRCGREGQT